MSVPFAITGRIVHGPVAEEGTWRRARMEVDPGRIVLEAPDVGRIELLPEHVLAIEPVTHFPFLDWGVRIRHVREDVGGRVEFLSRWRTPAGLLAAIAGAGFLALGRDVVPCLECGAELPEHDDRCRRCGWTFAGSGPTGAAGYPRSGDDV